VILRFFLHDRYDLTLATVEDREYTNTVGVVQRFCL
jgi:hypothetical protein